jgi:sensor histidine kinase YesM
MTTFLLLLIIPFTLLTNVFVYRFKSILTENEREYVNSKINVSTEQLDKMLQDMNGIISSLIINYNVIEILEGYTYPLSYEWFKEYKSLQNLLQSFTSNYDFNYQITILGANNNLYQSGGSHNNDLAINSPLVQYIKENNAVLVNRSLDGYNDIPIITYGRVVGTNNRFLGIILVDVTYEHMNGILNLFEEDDTYLYVIQDNNKILYSTDATIHSVAVPKQLQYALAREASSVIMNNKEYLLIQKTVPTKELTVVALVNSTSVFKESSDVLRDFILIFLLIIVGTAIGIIILTTFLSRNLRKLNTEMSNFGKEVGSTISVNIQSKDEVGQLATGFLSMSRRINLLLEEIKESERNKRKLEFQTLQAQVNPHMIYNTLNTITYLAQLQNVANIYEVSSSFAGLLHLISSSEGEYITIEAEIEYIQDYISIKKYNMICDMQVEYQIDTRVKNCYILKLLLQPIIENAIVHGFTNRTVDSLLTIRIMKQDSRIAIDIIDNGTGMDERTVTQIMSGQKKSKNNFTSIGIHNTMQRLQLQYGENSSFAIVSYPDIGTTVHIEFPMEEKV